MDEAGVECCRAEENVRRAAMGVELDRHLACERRQVETVEKRHGGSVARAGADLTGALTSGGRGARRPHR